MRYLHKDCKVYFNCKSNIFVRLLHENNQRSSFSKWKVFRFSTITKHVPRFHLWGNKEMALGLGGMEKRWSILNLTEQLQLRTRPGASADGHSTHDSLRSTTWEAALYQPWGTKAAAELFSPSTVVAFNLTHLWWQHLWSPLKECGSLSSWIKAGCHTNLNPYRLAKLRSACQVTLGKANADELLYSTPFPRLIW